MLATRGRFVPGSTPLNIAWKALAPLTRVMPACHAWRSWTSACTLSEQSVQPHQDYLILTALDSARSIGSRRSAGRRNSTGDVGGGNSSNADGSHHGSSVRGGRASGVHDSISSQSMSGAKFYEMAQKAARQSLPASPSSTSLNSRLD